MLQVTLAAPSTLSMVFFISKHIVTTFTKGFSFALIILFLDVQDRPSGHKGSPSNTILCFFLQKQLLAPFGPF